MSALIKGVDHVGVTVADLDTSLAFYGGLLGLAVIEKGEVEDVGNFVGIPGARLRAIDVDLGDGRILELLQYTFPEGTVLRQEPYGIGCLHMAFRVDDIEQVLAKLAEAGYPPMGTPTTITGTIAWDGATVVYLRDPDGALVELIQRPPSAVRDRRSG